MFLVRAIKCWFIWGGIDCLGWGLQLGKVGIIGISNRGSVGVDIPSGIIVLIGKKGCVVGNSNVICVSGSWGSLCFFVSCESSLDSCCWSSSFRLFVRSCSSTGSFSACGSKVVISSMNGVGDWGGGPSLVADSSGVLSNFRFFV